MRVLAVADGEGRNSVWMAKQGLKVDAFDISPVGIEKAKKLAQQNGVDVNFSVCGVEDYPWKALEYDAVVAIFIQFADPDTRATLFRRMKSALKPDGLLLLQGYTPKQLEYKTGGPPNLDHLYTEDLLREGAQRMGAAFEQIGDRAASTVQAHSPHPLMHRTESVDYGVVIEGEMTVIIDGKETVLKKFDSCTIAPNEVRVIENRTNHTCTMMVVIPYPPGVKP